MADIPESEAKEHERAQALAAAVAQSHIGIREGRTVEMKAGFDEHPPQKTAQPETAAADGNQTQAPEVKSHTLHDDIQSILSKSVLQEAPQKKEAPQLKPEVAAQTQIVQEIAQSTQRPLEVKLPVTHTPPTTLENKAAVLHTLKQDVDDLVQKRKVSMVRAIALESDGATAETAGQDPVQKNSSGVLFAAIGIGLLAMMIMGVGYYALTLKEAGGVARENQARYDNTLVFFEHVQPFDVTDLESFELRGGLAKVRDDIPATAGSVTLIDFFERVYDPSTQSRVSVPVGLGTLLNIMKPRMPQTLVSVLTPTYFIGVHASDVNVPFILMKVTSPDHAFAGMLDWEKQMSQDLQPFLEIRGVPLGGDLPQFSDLAIENIDARILREEDGTIRIIYAIVERNVVVITNSITTLKELADRIHTQVLKTKGVIPN